MSVIANGHEPRIGFATRTKAVLLTKDRGWSNKTATELSEILGTKAEWTLRDSANLERLADASERIHRQQERDEESRAKAVYWNRWEIFWTGVQFVTPIEDRPSSLWWHLRTWARGQEEAFVTTFKASCKSQKDNFAWLDNACFMPDWRGRSARARWLRKYRPALSLDDD